MNSDTLIRQLAEADVYAPDHDLPETARTSTVALTEIRRRIDMDAKEMTKPVQPDTQRRSPWIIAASAAVVVILVVGLVAIMTTDGDDAAPATTPTTTLEGSAPTTTPVAIEDAAIEDAPTTTVFAPPELDASAVGYVQALVDELNAGDAAAAGTRIFSADTFEGPDASQDNQIDERSRTAGRWAVWTELESLVELIECTTLTTGGTRCEIARTSPFDWSSPNPELSMIQVRFDDEGNLVHMRSIPTAGAWNTPHLAFELWIQDNHPELWSTMFFNFSEPGVTADLVREFYPQWLEATGADG